MKVTIRTTVINGNIKRNRSQLVSAFKQFEGHDIDIAIQKAKKTRSNPQNRYYWGVIIPLIRKGLKDVTGEVWTAEATHDILKHKFLVDDVPLADGLFVERIKSTTELDTFDFCEFSERCRAFAAEYLGVSIPEPNEQMNFEL